MPATHMIPLHASFVIPANAGIHRTVRHACTPVMTMRAHHMEARS